MTASLCVTGGSLRWRLVTAFVVFVWIPLIVFVGVLSMMRDERWRRRLDAWAVREGYQLERVAQRWATFAFPFRSGAQRVYSIRVVDREGVRRTGVVRVGGYFLGARSDQVDVRWDR